MTNAETKRSPLSIITSVLLVIVFLAAALCVGSVRGWARDRGKAAEALSASSELGQMLEERGMDAANLAVVAARHLSETDADLTRLREASSLLLSSAASSNVKLAADVMATEAAAHLAGVLPELDSVKASARDQAYISTLTRTLGATSNARAAHDEACNAFNQRMQASLTGRLAMLLGVQPLR